MTGNHKYKRKELTLIIRNSENKYRIKIFYYFIGAIDVVLTFEYQSLKKRFT